MKDSCPICHDNHTSYEQVKALKFIVIDSEDICRAVETIDYELSGKLRAAFTHKQKDCLQVTPDKPIEIFHEVMTRVSSPQPTP